MTKYFDAPICLTDGRKLAWLDDAIASLSDSGWPARCPRHDEGLHIRLQDQERPPCAFRRPDGRNLPRRK